MGFRSSDTDYLGEALALGVLTILSPIISKSDP